jgi:two-component system heavy metal sensor histidine kinase CusS
MSLMIEAAAEDVGVMGPHLTIEKHIAPGIIVQTYPDLLRLVIQDLITNAVKYNLDNGLIRFRLAAENNPVLFTIVNTGPPIPISEQYRIFDRFYRVDKSRSQKVPGIGLGLSLAREIVRAHKGELRFDPAANDLIAFCLSFPCPL